MLGGCVMRCDQFATLCTDDTRRSPPASAVEDVDVAIAEINSLVAACPPTPRLALVEGRFIEDTATAGPPVTRALTAVAGEAIELSTVSAARSYGPVRHLAACCTSCRIIRAANGARPPAATVPGPPATIAAIAAAPAPTPREPGPASAAGQPCTGNPNSHPAHGHRPGDRTSTTAGSVRLVR